MNCHCSKTMTAIYNQISDCSLSAFDLEKSKHLKALYSESSFPRVW